MSVIYKSFFTVLSLSIVTALLFLAVFFVSLIFNKMNKKYTSIMWKILIVRALLPIAIFAPLTLNTNLNRFIHIVLNGLGYELSTDTSLLYDWRDILLKKGEAAIMFRITAFIWLAGFIVILLSGIIAETNRKKYLNKATRLFDNVYESYRINKPYICGCFNHKIYIPAGMDALTVKNIIKHADIHFHRGDVICKKMSFLMVSLHWFNPFMWGIYTLLLRDMEMACDDHNVSQLLKNNKITYAEASKSIAQEIINYEKIREVAPEIIIKESPYIEAHLSERSHRLIYKKKTRNFEHLIYHFLVLLLVYVAFFAGITGKSWNHGTWEKQENVTEVATKTVINADTVQSVKDKIITQVKTYAASDSAVTVSLVMTKGTYSENSGYKGSCELKLADDKGKTIDIINLKEIYKDKKQFEFNDSTTFAVGDYNEDGINEVSIGQLVNIPVGKISTITTAQAVKLKKEIKSEKSKVATENSKVATEKSKATTGNSISPYLVNASGQAVSLPGKGTTSIREYFLLSINKNKLEVQSEPIYMTDATIAQMGSTEFSYIQNAGGVIYTNVEGNIIYYVWDDDMKMYINQELSDDELNNRIIVLDSGSDEESGDLNIHEIKNTETKDIAIRVKTIADDNGGEVIQNISLSPNGLSRTFNNIKGYYCNLFWASTASGIDKNRYAVLLYNGTKAQTFVIYDIKDKEIYYSQEDGNSILNTVFRQYNGSDITFSSKNPAVYSLSKIDENDVIELKFAAETSEGLTIKGSYKYDINKKTNSDLTYSQSGSNATQEP